MRAYHILPLFLLGLSPVSLTWAATPAVPIDQRIQHIEVQDADVRINELRVGGETQTITVKPTNGLPAYEVIPANGARNRTIDGRDGGQGSVGSRVWKLFNF
ncbi:hypothetical protein [Rhodoferax sp.]|uniref:hypothetical protein n=1 Tax=Rhodoferax sp. TaxID=50421 RepID=UPI0025D0126D|nr:hypothetical protein [Rhodoferax sp.]